MQVIGIAMTALSAVTSIMGGMAGASEARSQAAAQAASLQADAQANDMNAQIAQQNANLESQRRSDELRDSRRKFNLLQGTTRAQSGALGIFGGSTLDVLSDIATQGIFEQTSIIRERTSAEVGNIQQGNAYKVKASGQRYSAEQTLAAGKSKARASLIAGFGSAFTTVGSAFAQSGSGGSSSPGGSIVGQLGGSVPVA